MATEKEIMDRYEAIVWEFDKFNDLLKKTELEKKAQLWNDFNAKPNKTVKDFEDFQKSDLDLLLTTIERRTEAWKKLESDLQKYTAHLSAEDRMLIERSARMFGIQRKKNIMQPLISDYIYQELIQKAKTLEELKSIIGQYAFPIITIINGRNYDIKAQVIQQIDILINKPDTNWNVISPSLTDTFGIRNVIKRLNDEQKHQRNIKIPGKNGKPGKKTQTVTQAEFTPPSATVPTSIAQPVGNQAVSIDGLIETMESLEEMRAALGQFRFPIKNSRGYDVSGQILQQLDALIRDPLVNWEEITPQLTDTYGIREKIKILKENRVNEINKRIIQTPVPPVVTVKPIGKPTPVGTEALQQKKAALAEGMKPMSQMQDMMPRAQDQDQDKKPISKMQEKRPPTQQKQGKRHKH